MLSNLHLHCKYVINLFFFFFLQSSINFSFCLEQKIREVILKNDFKVVRTRRLTITPKLGSEFYADHKNKFFYTRLITFMSSGPSDVHILASQNAITKWRELLGPTKAIQAQYTAPDSIRGKYGLSDTRNAAHGAGNFHKF